MTILIEVPSCAASFHDLRAPVHIVRWNCNCKCNGRCHDHSAKNSAEKNTFHIVPFDHFIIESCLQIGPPFDDNLIASGFAAACERGNFEPVAAALWATQTLRTAKRLQQRLHAIDSYDLPGVRPIFRFRY